MLKIILLFSKFRQELSLVWVMLRDSRTPLMAKILSVVAAIYVLSPIDLVTDFLPILGWLDDGIIAWLLIKWAKNLLPQELLDALKAKSGPSNSNESK